ncbi:sigma 54-interacting transcriptional regulator [Mucilaginibacter aquaedulcis]|uniref:sigma 54-interacting transcriptional regulator n=1 Tax=Mucilaginibacter aquaedulcis TaxID=1187081 RepID=UPI0025B4F5BB|nr:sigma 54-interacting transcriptional regulator [Mucilaginibacter aquaedulcis]MDN3548868.1 sigma 54-interacting transcriptional regulator [Mucilaginibacter aquaedulcis]
MSEKILIVEDVFLEANNLRIILEKSGHVVCGVARSFDHAVQLVRQEHPDIVLIDIFLKGKLTGIDLARWLSRSGIAFIFLSANSNASTLEAAKATQPYGFLVKPFRERDILVALEIAVFRHRHMHELRLRQERWLTDMLNNILATKINKHQQLLLLAKAFQPFIQFDYILIETDMESDRTDSVYGFQRTNYEEYSTLDTTEFFEHFAISISDLSAIRQMYIDDSSIRYQNGEDFIRACSTNKINENFSESFGVKSGMMVPIIPLQGIKGAISFLSKQQTCFSDDHLELIAPLTPLLVSIIQNISKNQRETSTGELNKAQRGYPAKPDFTGIIGKSSKLRFVLDQVTQVAPYDTSVLIFGETGVGKEGLVEAIHQCSPRKTKPLIKINCAAMAAGLVESELFGHERGAYTDARERRIGKFEQAQGGTIFLDEIGEIPLDVQTKLLRVLQEKEIERVGGRGTIKVDVRIIAATNRDLYKEVGSGNFRMDLYYRINVFPIELPPLRERTEDIPLLVDYFLNRHARMNGEEQKSVAPDVISGMLEYSWPGNIRELQHTLERHILTTKGPLITSLMLPERSGVAVTVKEQKRSRPQTIEEVEKAHILMVIQECNGRISGKGGAAEILQLPPSSLRLKMNKLGIAWQHTIK